MLPTLLPLAATLTAGLLIALSVKAQRRPKRIRIKVRDDRR